MQFSRSKLRPRFKAHIYRGVSKDSFHITEKGRKEKKEKRKKSKGFLRKSKSKIQPCVTHLQLFKFRSVWQGAFVLIF